MIGLSAPPIGIAGTLGATDNRLPRSDGTGGNTLQATGLTVSDTDDLTVPGTITLTGGQLVFPATQSASAGANTLDDYEEGTWTPTMTFNNSAVSVAYTTQTGKYVKVGQIVYLHGHILLSNNGTGVGTAKILGNPFTATAVQTGFLGMDGWAGCSAIVGNLMLSVNASGTDNVVYMSGAAAAAACSDTNITNTADLSFGGTYQASA